MAGCGGACGGDCSCSSRKAGEPRRFGIKANDVNIVTAARALMLEDAVGNVVVLREQDYYALMAEVTYWKHESGASGAVPHGDHTDCGSGT